MPVLFNVSNNVSRLPLAAAYVPGSGTMVLGVSASLLPAPPFRITVVTQATYGTISEILTIFNVSAISDANPVSGKCTLTLSVGEGTVDRSFGIGDLADLRITAASVMDLNAAVANLGTPTTVGGDLSGTLPNPIVVSTNHVPFGTMATQNANVVNITGGVITGLSTPVSSSDAANKSYVDAATTGLGPKSACVLATTANLTATYSNGASGVGATLTNSGALAALTLDGVAVSTNDRILVKDQTTTSQNGIYVATNIGSGSVAWILTRATDYNSSANVSEGTYTVASKGTVQKGTMWIETGVGPFTIGTTPIVFTQMAVTTLTTTFSGDISGSGSGVIATTVVALNGVPLGSTAAVAGNLLIASGTQWVSVHPTGDATISTAGLIIVTKTNGVSFAPSAIIDTTDANNITSGIIPTARLGSGTANTTTFLRGDRTWAAVSGGGKFTWIFASGTPASVGIDKTAWAIVDQDRVLSKVYICAKTAPTGASLVVDILYSTNNGVTFTSLWAAHPANRPTLVSGSNFGTTATFDTTNLAAGNLLRVDIVQVGYTVPGQDITVQLQY